MLPAFTEKHSDRNTAVCLRHASQPDGGARLLRDGREKNTLDPLKTCWTSKLPAAAAAFAAFGTTSSSLNSDQTKQGWLYCGPLGTVAGTYSCNARPVSQLSQPQDTVTPILGGYYFFFLKALFLRLQKTQPQKKSIRAIKKGTNSHLPMASGSSS